LVVLGFEHRASCLLEPLLGSSPRFLKSTKFVIVVGLATNVKHLPFRLFFFETGSY
jgi:hypothetical protein